jgi:hypothetical protein
MDRATLILTLILPQLESASKILAAKDANATGKDDQVARILHYAYVAGQAILNDQPVPEAPTNL